MKLKLHYFVFLLCISLTGYAQELQKNYINYQGVANDASGDAIVETAIAIQIALKFGSTTATASYIENHSVTTDVNGVFSLQIGNGTAISGTYDATSWGTDASYITVSLNGVEVGTTEMVAVPYALNALTSSDSYWDKNPNGISNIIDDIGIGSDTLSAKLAIFQNSTATKPHILLKEEGNDFARLSFTNTNHPNNSPNIKFSIDGYIGSSESGRSDILTFRNDRTGNRLTFNNDRTGDLMTLTGDGEVGIGVGISPKVDLHVGEGKSVLFGKDTLGSGAKLMFLPDLRAFRVGTLSNAASTYWARDSIGLYSFASGYNTRAQGFGATAMGRDTEGQGDYSMATGYFTNADGQFSTAMGYNTDAFGTGSTALGYATDATGDYSFAVGHTAEAQAIYSVAIGNRVKAQSYASTAIGSYNIGNGTADSWLDEDPILEVGIGLSVGTRENALTILKDGKHGILTNQPKANLHVKDDGIVGSGTIVAILESDVSDRPILQFSEASNGGSSSGMSIEYDGAGTGGDNKMHINKTDGLPVITFDNGGQVGIGVSSPTFALHLPNNSNTGSARASSWGTYSDQRIKSNIASLQYGLETVLSLRPVTYNQHKSSFVNSKLVLDNERSNTIGLLAQEVHAIIPEAVIKPADENEQLWGMDYDKLIPVLIKAIQEQQAQIETLKTKNKTQDTVLGEVLKRLDTLENTIEKREKLDLVSNNK